MSPVHVPQRKINAALVNSTPALRDGRRVFWERHLSSLLPPRRRHVRLFFIGDSTIRNLFDALCIAMTARRHDVDVSPRTRSWLPEVAWCATHAGGPHLTAVFGSCLGNGIHADAAAAMRAELPDAPRADAIVLGAGLWLLWPMPFHAAGWDAAWQEFNTWRLYETVLATTLDRFEMHADGVLALTTHPICEALMKRDMGLWGKLAREHAQPAVWRNREKRCAQWVAGVWDNSSQAMQGDASKDLLGMSLQPPRRKYRPGTQQLVHVPLDMAWRSCAEGAHLAVGPEALNRRLHAVLRGRRAGRSRLVDTYALLRGQCEGANLPGDHCHFHLAIYDELSFVFDHLVWRGGIGD